MATTAIKRRMRVGRMIFIIRNELMTYTDRESGRVPVVIIGCKFRSFLSKEENFLAPYQIYFVT